MDTFCGHFLWKLFVDIFLDTIIGVCINSFGTNLKKFGFIKKKEIGALSVNFFPFCNQLRDSVFPVCRVL